MMTVLFLDIKTDMVNYTYYNINRLHFYNEFCRGLGISEFGTSLSESQTDAKRSMPFLAATAVSIASNPTRDRPK